MPPSSGPAVRLTTLSMLIPRPCLRRSPVPLCRRYHIRAGERVLIQMRDESPLMTKKLKVGEQTSLRYGSVRHDDLIGRKPRDMVHTSTGHTVRVIVPTLADYCTKTPRQVTPIYPSDANLITSLLDINVGAPEEQSDDPVFEVLEVGTGHGALTLHLARAVHAGNVHARILAQNPVQEGLTSGQDVHGDDHDSAHKKLRRAVIHTLDVSKDNSEYAKRIVSGFRHGMYSGNVDFHVGNIDSWITSQRLSRNLSAKDSTGFLSHMVFDIPDADRHIGLAASALRTDGGLIVFNPSISQIMAIVDLIKREYLPLRLEQVLEIGPGQSGGREWSVESLRRRPEKNAEGLRTNSGAGDGGADDAGNANPEVQGEAAPVESVKMISRPKVGYTVVGGGFVGFWRKMHRPLR